MGSLHIQNLTYSIGEESFSRIEDLEFWAPLLHEVLPLFTEVEVHCWVDEKEAIRLIKPFAHTIRTENSMVIFTMPLIERLRDLLLKSAINDRDSIHWFSLFFKKNGSVVYSVEHHGSELHFYQISKEEYIHIQSFFPRESIFHYLD